MDNYTHGSILPVNLVEEMETSFINYSMSVITSRALPDVRDGLKPVHRRILYAMYQMGLFYNKGHKKSSHVTGKVMADYHPHGDAAIYDAMVRLAQDFSMRYPLVDGQGNFGNIDGYPAAAQRYTEAKMAKIAHEMLKDIDKETVDFAPNYDESTTEPTVLPSRYPNLLVNGSSGIAVGMATNIPPHNLTEVIDGVLAYIDNNDISVDELIKHVKGPDFPTGGTIIGHKGIKDAYHTGRGSISLRGKAVIEKMTNGKNRIVISEIPYQVNKASMVEKIADLTKDKVLDGITALRDESDKDGMRVVVELRRDANPQILLNKLYKNTQLQQNFNVIMLALVDGTPKILDLKTMIGEYVAHQEEIIIKRTTYNLRKAEERAHIVQGLKIAVDNIDEVISIIRASYDDEMSRDKLKERFGLSQRQSQAVIEMQLRRLQRLNQEKLEAELKELLEKIAEYQAILADRQKVLAIIKEEISEVKTNFGDKRRTDITYDEGEINIEDLIADEDVVITVSHAGYIKRMPMDAYKNQKRGGKGVSSTSMKEKDFVTQIFITTTHHYLLFFTNRGRVLRLKTYEIPENSRQAKGMAIVNLLNISGGEQITAVIALKDYEENKYLTCATKKGYIKKTKLSDYDTNRKDGINAIRLEEGDELIAVRLTDGQEEIMLITEDGYAVRFNEDNVRPTGRVARGVRGINLRADDRVVSMESASQKGSLCIISENGYGKRTALEEYATTKARGGKGVITFKVSEKTGKVAAGLVVLEGEEVMVISKEGTLIRLSTSDISIFSRNTQGVKVMRLGDGDNVIAAARIAGEDN